MSRLAYVAHAGALINNEEGQVQQGPLVNNSSVTHMPTSSFLQLACFPREDVASTISTQHYTTPETGTPHESEALANSNISPKDCPIAKSSTEILLRIAGFLERPDLARLALVSQRMAIIARDEMYREPNCSAVSRDGRIKYYSKDTVHFPTDYIL